MSTRFFTKMAIYIAFFVSFSMTSCSDDKVEAVNPPQITIEQENTTFITKVGKEITIEPTYENVERASFAWKIDHKIVSTNPTFTYKSDEAQDVFITLEVINEAGLAFKEMKITVASLVIPTLSLPVPPDGYKIVFDSELELAPEVEEASEEIGYKWYVNDKEMANTKNYTFSSGTTGIFQLKVVASTEDGDDTIEFPVEVCKPEDLPFKWTFERETFSLSQGRNIRIKIWDIENDFDATYIWQVNGEKKQEGKESRFIFGESTMGSYQVKVTMKNQYMEVSKTLEVNVCEPEGTHQRAVTGGSNKDWNKVYEFLPAPGQFVNEYYTATTMAEAIAYAEERLKTEAYVSLGGWGGYVTVGFDHSVVNDGSYNIQVLGNSFAGSSEPGIVWVMQDENGNGLPDDTWYELKGSEYGKPETIQDYSVTYYKPKAPKMNVQWTDNQGKSGVVDYMSAYHFQDYYYPSWVAEETYTLHGTCLKSRTYDQSGNGTYWVNESFDWGYADNYSPIDRLTDDENAGAAANGNHFKISDAVTFDGKPANLKYIDFVKIQTGVNVKAGWLGENSTEVFGIKDYNLIKK
ncbi:PKD-like domain-containing protein [Proteiniphilum sp. UBA5384]|uniref:PKD-like domain-containing protein n=1 Tax=Proteiniphilum sp. UBA5384 TaxID=1947279 RepID=UPI0025E3763C|nr:PKD-like domain-containing protein [Proteiniphilum sp. UBA5384]